MVHTSSSGSTLSSASSPSSGSTTEFKVYGSVFKVSSRYQFLNALGKGSYGIVCAAKDRETGQCVAIKKVTPMARRTADAKHTLREVLLLQHLGKHPNVISIHNLSANIKDDELYIIMDLMETDMHRVIQSSQPLSDAHAKHFLHQLLRGVKYLHDNGVLHRDLKPGNLLLSKSCQLKIADFGLARKIPRRFSTSVTRLERPKSAPAASIKFKGPERPPMTEHVVTRWYRAPELMLQPDGLYDQSVDMWSVGCIFAEILGRKALFPGKNFLHQLTLIFNIIGAPSPEATVRIQSSQAQRFLKSIGRKAKVSLHTLFPTAADAAVDLLERMLEFDPMKRISAQEALNHPYMDEIERKARHRGIEDPPPCMRADFSFDQKHLSKMDLRMLIVNEVDHHRKLGLSASEERGEKREFHTAPNKNGFNLRSTSPDSTTSSISGARINKVYEKRCLNQELQEERQVTSVVKFGSNRQRIRISSKPPVPKQQAFDVPTSNQQEHVQVVQAQATLIANSAPSQVSPPLGKGAKSEAMIEILPTQLRKSLTATETLKSHFLTNSFIKANPTKDLNTRESGSDALATAITLTKGSKASIASLAVSVKTPASTLALVQQSQAWQTKESKNPEHSPSSSSSASTRQESNVCTGVYRVNRPESAMFISKSEKIKSDENVAARKGVGRPRRVCSAGTTRLKRPLPQSAVRNSSIRSAYVGSINSLIQAQRLHNGQSLADLADTMLATMRQKDKSFVSREENDLSNMNALREKSQQFDANVPGPDFLGKKHHSKKLTVPKSPKFSVMSWQKKNQD